MRRILTLVLAIFGWVLNSHSAGLAVEELLSSFQFRSYLECLKVYREAYPGVYVAPELLRLDELPLEDFKKEVDAYSSKWNELKARSGSQKKIHESKIQLSREANSSLLDLVKKQIKLGKKIFGSHEKILKAIPVELRTDLSPLDTLFLSSEIGKKLVSDWSRKKNFSAEKLQYDPKSKTLTFTPQSTGPQVSYQLIQEPSSRAETSRFKASFGKNQNSQERVGKDLEIRNENLRGTFFNSKSKDPRFFGAYPKEKEIWFEPGQTEPHFDGDGHDHHGHNHAH